MTATRRTLLKASVGLSFAFLLPSARGAGNGDEQDNASGSPYAWVNIAPSGEITIQAPADELGQGSMTALPLILAEELDASWDDVIIEFSPPDDETYGNPRLAGLVLTVASMAVATYFDRLRLHGAQMRRVLLERAAEHWSVDVSELRTAPSQVIHDVSGRRLSYGEIAGLGGFPRVVPEISAADLKSQSQFRLIGSDIERRDLRAKSSGAARYSIDVELPKMLYATVIRPSIRGARITNIDAARARTIDNLTEIVDLGDRVAILAETYPAALQARRVAVVRWDAESSFASEEEQMRRAAIVSDLDVPAFPWEQHGDIAGAFATSASTVDALYLTDYVYHAQMEPLNSVARYHARTGQLEIWAGTQAPSHCVRSVAAATGLDEKDVELHRMYSGGAFGRRGAYDHDYVVDAALLAIRTGRPVKLVWSREDDVRLGRLKPMTAQYIRAGFDGNGRLVAWHHRVCSEESLIQGDPERYEKRGKVPITAIYGTEQKVYDIPNRTAEHILADSNVRVSPLRGVGVTPNRFAAECFIDELAAARRIDPLAFRLGLAAHDSRATRVLTEVSGMADWHRRRKNTALGLAFTAYDETMMACITEISADTRRGVITVHNVWLAADPGLVIQPRNAESQLEGGIIFGISNALIERVHIENGEIQQSNFTDYPVLRMREAPAIRVKLISSGDRPSAIGEAGALLLPAAIGNAFARLTGRRLRHMPFTPERIGRA